MRSKALLTALAFSAAIVSSSGAKAIDYQRQQEYARIAGRLVSFADACMSMDAVKGPLAVLDEIETHMRAFGATEEEYVEWKSTLISTKSPDIQKMFKDHDGRTIRGACMSGLISNREKLDAILTGAQLESPNSGNSVDTSRLQTNP